MLIEFHLLQSFAPSNLNRDDTGSPKDCEFGGVRRARISSQCLKRTMRTWVRGQDLYDLRGSGHLAERTRLLRDVIADRLVKAGAVELNDAEQILTAALQGMGYSMGDDGRTQVLIFLGADELDGLEAACTEHSAVLLESARKAAPKTPGGKIGKIDVPDAVKKALQKTLNGKAAADLAMYGRMLAEMPASKVDAASQVAHAISTHRASIEFDYFTAVDDLKPLDVDAGAGMLGTVEFTSACYYRYQNVHVEQLVKNLGGDRTLAAQATSAFLRAAVEAVPSGKQNSMAALNPPALALAVVRDGGGGWSLANAFEKPVRTGGMDGIVQESVRRLDAEFGTMQRLYGEWAGLKQTLCCTAGHDGELAVLGASTVQSWPELVSRTVEAAFGGAPA